MMSMMRISALTAFLLLSVLLCASNAQAQACGRAFVEVTVSDSEGRSIPDATIELIAEVPREKYDEERQNEAAVKISPGNGTAIKISEQEAEEIVSLSSPLSRTEDICENPLKQQANSTNVKRNPSDENTEESTMNLGFCTLEGNSRPLLLKVSAPGYVTDYYVGPFLGGCHRIYKIVLT